MAYEENYCSICAWVFHPQIELYPPDDFSWNRVDHQLRHSEQAGEREREKLLPSLSTVIMEGRMRGSEQKETEEQSERISNSHECTFSILPSTWIVTFLFFSPNEKTEKKGEGERKIVFHSPQHLTIFWANELLFLPVNEENERV